MLSIMVAVFKKLAIFAPVKTVLLPFNCNSKTMQNVIAAVFDEELNPVAEKIAFDFSRLRFVDPSAITILSNVIEYLIRKKGVDVGFRNMSFTTEGNKFLDDSRFFEQYTGKQVFAGCKLRPTTLPLEIVRHDRSWNWIHNTFSDWIEYRVGLSKDSVGSINVCLSEIFNNIIDHSGEDVGCVFAQHYPKTNTVMLSISDFGRGIPANVRKVRPGISDSDAIAQAVVEGFTTKSTLRNQGAGLNVLTRYVVNQNGGKVFVQSLKGTFHALSTASGPRHIPGRQAVSYPGTLIQFEFRTDSLEKVSQKEAFEW